MIAEIKEKLIDNPVHIQNILEFYGFYNIKLSSKEIRCGIEENSNKNSIQIKLQNNDYLYATDYARDINHDLIGFIMKVKKTDFKNVINVIKKELGVEHFTYKKPISIFDGFYDNIKVKKYSNNIIKPLDEDILIPYSNKFNTRFLNDNISFESQKKFKIGLDVVTQRITCPWWNFEGGLVGITGRYNGNYEEDGVSKWLPVIPHSKSQTLYGYVENYEHLQGCDELYIGESEKFVLQLDSMDIFTSLALGGNSIHTYQINNVIALNPKKIIFGYDEGLEEETILNQIHKFKEINKFLDIQIGYITDKNNVILPKNSKSSPTDLGKEKFLELKNKYTKWM